jgi:hypothetical protein
MLNKKQHSCMQFAHIMYTLWYLLLAPSDWYQRKVIYYIRHCSQLVLDMYTTSWCSGLFVLSATPTNTSITELLIGFRYNLYGIREIS